MNNKIIAQGLEDLFCDKRITIVYGVLKRLHITPSYSDYDDLFQEGHLAYAAYADFTNQPSTANLAAFAYQRIYWRLLDLLRRRQYGEVLQEYSLDDQPLLECGQTDPALFPQPTPLPPRQAQPPAQRPANYRLLRCQPGRGLPVEEGIDCKGPAAQLQ